MIRAAAKFACVAVACAMALTLCGEPAQGYMTTRVDTSNNPGSAGLSIKWDLANTAALPNIANRRVRYEIGSAGCADHGGFTGPVDEFQAIQNSFNHWRNIEASELDFEFAGVTGDAVTNATDNRNVIRFLGADVTAGVFAQTIVTFDTDNGEITDADMEINDRDFTWDTIGETPAAGPVGRAVIENIVTHEIGHLAGLAHPTNAQSTMFFASSPGLINQSTPEVDDSAPVVKAYPSSEFTQPDAGTVAGTVRSSGVGVFGVSVVLVDITTGRNVIGHVTEKQPVAVQNGDYRITGVPPGNYLAFALAVEPTHLGEFYSSAFTTFFPVVRGVTVAAPGAPSLVHVAPGENVTGIDIDLAPTASDPFAGDDSSGGATAIASGEVACAKIAPASDADYFQFTATSAQHVTLRVLSDTFGFSLNPTLTLYDTDGTTVLVSPSSSSAAFQASANDIDGAAFDLDGVNYDAEIEFDLPGAGTYFAAVRSRLGVTSGPYIFTCELSGDDVTPDAAASTIEASAPGVAAGSAQTVDITVTPRNRFARDLLTPLTFTVDLVDRGNGDAILDTITADSAPFVFNVAALASADTVIYGARIDGTLVDATVKVSHHGALSLANSRVRSVQTSLVANGVDHGLILVELRDGANNLFLDTSTAVNVSTTLGTLNGSMTGVAATFSAARRAWTIELVAGANTGTANVTATAGGSPVAGAKAVPILARASTATSSPNQPAPGGDDDDSGGGCAAGGAGAGVLLLIALAAALRRRRRLAASR